MATTEKRVTGKLKFECHSETEAMMMLAEFTERARGLGWDVDDIYVTVDVDENGNDKQ